MGALWFETALLPNGWAQNVRLTFRDGIIASIDVGAPPEAGDERRGIAVPGLANVHSHAFQRAMAGLAEHRLAARDDFWSWREVMYRFLGRLTPDDVQSIAAQAYVETLQSGFTRVGEFHYLHHDPAGRPYAAPAEMAERVAAAAEVAGIGLTLLPVYYRQGGFGGAPAGPGQRRFLSEGPDAFARLLEASRSALASLPDANLGIAPHSLRAVTPEDLAAILPLAGDGPVHIHAAEQTREVDDCLAWSGRRPVEWLLDHAAPDERWCVVHATHMTAEETSRLARSGAVAGLCPITEANLGDGVFPTPAYLADGGRIAIGADSNVFVDAAHELRALEYAQRLTRRARVVLACDDEAANGARLFRAALTGGAQALGVGPGGLRPGAPADIVSLRAEDPSLVGRAGDRLLDGWVFCSGKDAVDRVWRRGKLVVEGGRHHAAQPIAEAYRKTLRRLLA